MMTMSETPITVDDIQDNQERNMLAMARERADHDDIIEWRDVLMFWH